MYVCIRLLKKEDAKHKFIRFGNTLMKYANTVFDVQQISLQIIKYH